MRIETMTVKLLRSVESYTNDTIEFQVSLEEGDDWETIERDLRTRAVANIEQHWAKRRQAEEDERLKREAHEAEIIGKRDKYFEDVEVEQRDCSKCPALDGRLCGPCPIDIPF